MPPTIFPKVGRFVKFSTAGGDAIQSRWDDMNPAHFHISSQQATPRDLYFKFQIEQSRPASGFPVTRHQIRSRED